MICLYLYWHLKTNKRKRKTYRTKLKNHFSNLSRTFRKKKKKIKQINKYYSVWQFIPRIRTIIIIILIYLFIHFYWRFVFYMKLTFWEDFSFFFIIIIIILIFFSKWTLETGEIWYLYDQFFLKDARTRTAFSSINWFDGSRSNILFYCL